MSRLRTLLNFNDWPIFTKLTFVMILLAALPLLVSSTVSAASTANTMRQQIGDANSQLADAAANEVNRTLIEDLHMLELATVYSPIVSEVEKANSKYKGTPAEIESDLLKIDPVWKAAKDNDPLIANAIAKQASINPISSYLLQVQGKQPQLGEMFVTDRYGALLGATNRTSDYYQADEDWWIATWNKGAGAFYFSEPTYDESSKTTAIDIGVPVMGSDSKPIGVLRGTADVQQIVTVIKEIRIGQTGSAFLVNGQGLVLLDPHEEYVGKTVANVLRAPAVLQATKFGWLEAVNEAGVPSIVGHSNGNATVNTVPDVSKLGWNVFLAQESSEALAPVSSAIMIAIATGVLTVLLAALAAYWLARVLTRQINHITGLFGQIGVGNFTARAPVLSSDELGNMASSLNAMLDNTLSLIQSREERDAIQAAIRRLLDEVADVAKGDLTKEAQVTTDMTGAVADAFNLMTSQLRRIISRVQETSLQVSSSASEIQTTAEHLAKGSETQAHQIVDTSAALEEMAVSIQQVSDNATLSATVAEQALANAKQGAQAVQNTIVAMNRIRDQAQETSKRIKRLGESSQEISEIVRLIDDIADRTSILALNASIQAAMAGEAGRGFAIVAEEVERLAERSTAATRQIETLVKTIQGETNETVAAMEDSTREVVAGSQLANQAGGALSEIESVSHRLAELIQSISLASKQQARGAETLSQSMTEISDVTQQTAAGTKQAAVSINSLALLAEELRASVSTFKLSEA